MSARNYTLVRRKAQVINDLDVIDSDMTVLILSTPTGENRELLTEANIHLGAAREALRKAKVGDEISTI